jgi:MYXO-CTERM domain-containing protein
MTMTVRSTRRWIVRGTLGGIVAIFASGLGSVAFAANHDVDIASFAFSPGSVTVAVGDTVTWTNADPQGHTATADDASFDTGTIANGASKSVTFSTAGTIAYHCKIHPAMTATITVLADASTPPPTDTLEPSAAPGNPTPLAFLALAALGGLVIGRRRFSRQVVDSD